MDELYEVDGKFHVHVDSIKGLFNVEGYDGSDGILIKVGKDGIGNIAKLLGDGMKFTDAKLVRIEKVTAINVGKNLVNDEMFKDFTKEVEQRDGMVGNGIRFTFTRLGNRNDFSTFAGKGKIAK